MTDNDLIAKLKTYVALQRERPNEPMAIPDLAAEAAAVLRARDTELTRLRDALKVIHVAINGYCNECGGESPCATLRALASVSPPADTEEA